MMKWFYRLATPKYFYQFTGYCIPICAVFFLGLLVYGLVGALFLAPADYQQGDAFRIIYVHVPAAFLSLMIYLIMSIAAIFAYVWRIKLADLVLKVSVPIGAWFTLLALLTGAIWGKPMWGTWWVWDARLTSELILLFIYLGIIGLQSAITDKALAIRAVRLFVLVGVVNIPIIHYSVYWWNTLHQGSTLNLLKPSLIASSMLYPLLAMIGAFIVYYFLLLCIRMRHEIIRSERQMQCC
ncbi:MAG: heme ABC transporter permease [Gammaproteobacteria bacterium]